MVPSGLIVNGPHLPVPSPLTSKVDDAETIDDGVAVGNVFESPGMPAVFQSALRYSHNATGSPVR